MEYKEILAFLKNNYNEIEWGMVSDDIFNKFGRIIKSIDMSEIHEYLVNNTECPTDKVNYVAEDISLSETKAFTFIKEEVFGDMEIQLGYCNGFNTKLNALEFHQCSEAIYAVTDVILLLGEYDKMHNRMFESKNCVGFILPKGTLIELFPRVLHFAPITIKGSFITMIGLL